MAASVSVAAVNISSWLPLSTVTLPPATPLTEVATVNFTITSVALITVNLLSAMLLPLAFAADSSYPSSGVAWSVSTLFFSTLSPLLTSLLSFVNSLTVPFSVSSMVT